MGDQTVLVLGGTGKTGRRVVERLRSRGGPVRVASPSSEAPFDWNDRATWAPAVEGAAAVYVCYHPDLAVPGAPEAVAAFAAVAAGSGVRRLVLLSGRGEEQARRAEREVMASGLEWTVVRCSWFDQNFSEGAFRDHLAAGELALPAGDVPEPFVDADDIADVAVAALTGDGHAGEVYELTGPRLLTLAEAVDEIAAASGRRIRFVPVSHEEFGAGLAEAGLPDDATWLLTHLFREVLDGRNARLGDGVQRALGREPRDFRDYARAAAEAGAWTPAAVGGPS